MKQILALISVFLLLLTTVYLPISLILERELVRKEVKQRIKEGIPDDELQTFIFTLEEYAELEWEKREKEFEWKGYMYDIVRVKKQNNRLIVKAFKDLKETGVFADLERLISSELESSPNHSEKILVAGIVFDQNYYSDSSIGIPNYMYSKTSLIAIPYLNAYHSIDVEILSPPPQG